MEVRELPLFSDDAERALNDAVRLALHGEYDDASYILAEPLNRVESADPTERNAAWASQGARVRTVGGLIILGHALQEGLDNSQISAALKETNPYFEAALSATSVVLDGEVPLNAPEGMAPTAVRHHLYHQRGLAVAGLGLAATANRALFDSDDEVIGRVVAASSLVEMGEADPDHVKVIRVLSSLALRHEPSSQFEFRSPEGRLFADVAKGIHYARSRSR